MNRKCVFIICCLYAIGIILLGYFATHRYHVWHLVLSSRHQYFINMSYWTYATVLIALVYGGMYILRHQVW